MSIANEQRDWHEAGEEKHHEDHGHDAGGRPSMITEGPRAGGNHAFN
jgi:hypothetical protein